MKAWTWLKAGNRLWWAALGVLLAACILAAMKGGAGGSASASAEERRIAEVLSAMAGAGRVEVALFYEAEAVGAFGGASGSRPTGAVVVAQGAGDLRVRLELIRAVRTLLGLPQDAVDVFVMEERP